MLSMRVQITKRREKVCVSRVRMTATWVAAAALLTMACASSRPEADENTASVNQAVENGGSGDPIPCAALSDAIVANSGTVMLNSQVLVDSYQSTLGAYGGSNVGSGALVQAATSITNNGAVVHGSLVPNAPANLSAVPVPSGAINLPLGASAPGSLNINIAADSITLAPGNYVAANINVNSPGSINISPVGQVHIWVTGTLNLGGSENANGIPNNLEFFVTSSNTVNVNSGGSLYGLIDAPSSPVNINSPVFGSVIGSTVTLNSGAAVHYDGAEACPPPTTTVLTPTQLPPPPDVRGCYVGTWNGWIAVPCTPYDELPANIRHRPYMGGGQVTIPGYLNGGTMEFGPIPGITASSGLKFGQVASTFVDVATDSVGNTETNVPPQSAVLSGCKNGSSTPLQVSIQANTNNFNATTGDASINGDKAWVQFAIQAQESGSQPGFNVCIWNNDFDKGKADADFIPNPSAPSCTNAACEPGRTCVGGLCLARSYWPDCLATTNYAVTVGSGGFNLAVQARQFQPLDFATVAGSAFTDANDGQADLGLVAAMSWFDPLNNNNKNYHGLYAIVTKDRYGLGASTNWTTVSGTVLGLGDCGIATFPQGTMVHTSVQAGNCATQGTPPPPFTVTWPGVCPNTLGVSSSPAPTASTLSLTDESNNLNIVPNSQSALANSSDANNYLELHYLASVDGNCVSTPRVYVKDHPQDHGSTPSNLGGEAFWESPDIIVVTPGTTVTPTSPAGDPIVIAGKPYNIYVRVHNDYACSSIGGVRARVWWGDASLATPTWTNVITDGPDPSNPNWSASKSLPFGDSLDIIGPIPWTAPSNVTPHECLLVNIQAAGETAPTNTADAPNSYQVAQRNIEIGGACSWTLKSGGQSSQLGLTVTATNSSGQPYSITSGDSATVTFDDTSQALFNAWNTNAHPGCTLSHNNGPGTTTITMNTGVGQATVQGGPIAGNATINVSSTVIPALFSGTTIDLRIATFLTNGGSISPTNGATCSATAQTGIP